MTRSAAFTLARTPRSREARAAETRALVSEEERRAAYAQAWDQGGLSFRATFRDMMVN